jgi:hypothetical protein
MKEELTELNLLVGKLEQDNERLTADMGKVKSLNEEYETYVRKLEFKINE